LLDTFIVVDYKWIPVSLIFGMLTAKIVVTEEAVLKLPFCSALPVAARCAPTT